MAGLIHEITITMERRQVAIIFPCQPEKLGFFHRWSVKDDMALVEQVDGTMVYVRAGQIRFLPIGNEVPPHELETIYRENGLLLGGG